MNAIESMNIHMFVNITSLSKGRIWELRKRGVVRADNIYLVIILIDFF